MVNIPVRITLQFNTEIFRNKDRWRDSSIIQYAQNHLAPHLSALPHFLGDKRSGLNLHMAASAAIRDEAAQLRLNCARQSPRTPLELSIN